MAKDKTAKKLRVAQKQEKKAAQKEKKEKKRPKKHDADSDAEDDVDIDAILADYAKKQEQYLKVTEVVSEPPPPRSASTIIASPTDAREIFLFGGEHYNGALASFSNDLYVYRIPSDEWRKVTSPNSPLPRSGHAMCRGANNNLLYLFGGEFSSPKQGTFYHYSDLHALNPTTREWSKMESKGPGPSARSGHRLVPYKRYLVLYGGFQDTSQQTKYLNDLWIYDCQTFSWHSPTLPPAAARPDARSSFSFLPHDLGAVMIGGYARIKSSVSTHQSKAGRASSRLVLSPVVYQDAWLLRITAPEADAPHNALPVVRWERRKRPVNTPAPSRAGATMVHHKGRGLVFGGVHDVEASEEGIESEFFNQLMGYSVDRNRFFQMAVRKPRGPGKRSAPVERNRRARGKADEEELLRNLALLEAKGTLAANEDEMMGDVDMSLHDSEDVPAAVEKPVSFELPHPRFNAQLAVQNDMLYIYGGTFERGDREFTFDEMFAIDLGKLDGVREIFRREVEDWQGSDDEESEDDEDGDEDDDDMSVDEDPSDHVESQQQVSSKPDEPATDAVDAQASTLAADDIEVEDDEEPADGRPVPRPFESLRQFFVRTLQQWQDIVFEELKYKQGPANKTSKELRGTAFDKAEAKWWDCREEIQAIEDEHEEAGIGEVVDLADRSTAETGSGRRR